MTFREIWLTLIGRPERAAMDETSASSCNGDDDRLETLDWFTTDSPATLKKRADVAASKRTSID